MRLASRLGVLTAMVVGSVAMAQAPGGPGRETWVTRDGQAAGTDQRARQQAVDAALRSAVEQACGVFIKAQSESRDYKVVYDRVIANTPGFVREYSVTREWVEAGVTNVTVRALVSTRKFEEDWAAIAHTVAREGNPRVVVVIGETSRGADFRDDQQAVAEFGLVQAAVEDFLLSKGLMLVDRGTSERVSKRDIMLASLRDDTAAVAAAGARFKADVVIVGEASAVFSRQIRIGDATLFQYSADLRVRAIRSDTAQVLVSRSFGPVTHNSTQRLGGERQALSKLAEEAAPKVLDAVVEAWRKQVHQARNIQLEISGMNYTAWMAFRQELRELPGVQEAVQREITESVATIDVQHERSLEDLADALVKLKGTQLEITEISANRIRLKLLK